MYICLLLSDATVLSGVCLRALNDRDALMESKEVCKTNPACTGYEVWRDGRRLLLREGVAKDQVH